LYELISQVVRRLLLVRAAAATRKHTMVGQKYF